MKIAIVGGGSAGWMTAAYLSRNYTVTLIESKDIPIVGVGESTLPLMKEFCEELGLSEEEWMPKCNAVHKLGIKHNNWKKDKQEPWWHWFLTDRNDHNKFDHVEKGTLPKNKFGYAYHVDATKFGTEVMKPYAIKNGVNHVIDKVEDIVLAEDGSVDYIILENNRDTKFDLYVDCSGFAKIFSKKLDIKFKKFKSLKNNRAIACPQPLDGTPARYTVTKTMNHGWLWEICLTNRKGVGYVYSSDFVSDEDAINEYLEHYPNTDKSKMRVLKFTPEYATTPFYKNVALIGLSAGFFEPLEANGIWLISFNILGLDKCIKDNIPFKVFNRRFNSVMEDLRIFILSHYTLSNLDHTPYWQYYKKLEQSDNTRSVVEQRAKETDIDFGSTLRIFPPYSWWSKDKYFLRS